MSIARCRTVVGSLYGLMRNALGLNVATPLESQELSCTVAPDRRLVVLGHEPIAGFARDHGTVADEAAMLALHTLDSTTLLAEPTFVAPGDSCLRTDDPGWRWHCISGHGQSMSDWERRPLGGALSGLAVSGHTHAISAITGLQSELDGKQPTLTNAAVVAELGDSGGALTYNGTPLGGGSASYGVSARVRLTTAYSIPSSTQTAIPFTEVIWDTGGFWTAGSPTVFTIPAAGIYLVCVQVVYDVNSTGIRIVDILINNSAARLNRTQIYASPVGATAINATAALNLSGGDTVSLGLWQNSGGAVDAYAAAGSDATSMSILRIG